MSTGSFTATKNARGRDVIRSSSSTMEISIFYLNREKFRPGNGMLIFYGDNKGSLLAFATYPAYDVEEITAALKWYAEYIQHPHMEIKLTDPRPKVN